VLDALLAVGLALLLLASCSPLPSRSIRRPPPTFIVASIPKSATSTPAARFTCDPTEEEVVEVAEYAAPENHDKRAGGAEGGGAEVLLHKP
jgi:hypothetical protein